MTKRVTPRRAVRMGLTPPMRRPSWPSWPLWSSPSPSLWQGAAVLAGLFILAILGFYLHGTLRGKFVVWAELLEQLNLRGDERILDMGCGRGAVLLMAAQHLTTGRAVGVDLWRSGRSVRQFPRGHPAQRRRRGRRGSGRIAHGRHDGAAL